MSYAKKSFKNILGRKMPSKPPDQGCNKLLNFSLSSTEEERENKARRRFGGSMREWPCRLVSVLPRLDKQCPAGVSSSDEASPSPSRLRLNRFANFRR